MGVYQAPEQPLQDWYIVFRRSSEQHWWHWFLKDGWTHCYAIRFDGFNWVRFEPNLSYFDIQVLAVVESEDLSVIQGDVAIHTVQEIDHSRSRAPWIWAPITCVEAIKALLGIRKFWLFTPWQLYQHLLRDDDGQLTEDTGTDPGRAGTRGGADQRAAQARGRRAAPGRCPGPQAAGPGEPDLRQRAGHRGRRAADHPQPVRAGGAARLQASHRSAA